MSDLIRYTEMKERLKERGVTRWELEKLIEAKVIVGRALRPGARKFYTWSEVEAALAARK